MILIHYKHYQGEGVGVLYACDENWWDVETADGEKRSLNAKLNEIRPATLAETGEFLKVREAQAVAREQAETIRNDSWPGGIHGQ